MSRRLLVLALAGGAVLALGRGVQTPSVARAADPDWAANLTVIEACSCPMFCQCYFNTKPADHSGHGAHGAQGAKHFCRAYNAYRMNRGHSGATMIDGAKFWIATDLGDDFADGEMEWAVLYFDKVLTPPQREAIQTIVGYLFPVKWKS